MNELKEICKNKASGKYFLLIEEVNDERLLLVIPTGEVKHLEASLFEDIEEANLKRVLSRKVLLQICFWLL
jgi:uncharacterized membrane protein